MFHSYSKKQLPFSCDLSTIKFHCFRETSQRTTGREDNQKDERTLFGETVTQKNIFPFHSSSLYVIVSKICCWLLPSIFFQIKKLLVFIATSHSVK